MPEEDIAFAWRSEHPSETEEKRADVLAHKPACKLCGRMFHTAYRPPSSLICRDCRDSPPPDPDPAEVLF